MGRIKLCLLLIYCVLFGICEGGRYGGGGSRSRPSTSYSRPSTSYSRPSYSRPSPSPSYSRPSPSYSHPSPSPSYSRPSPSYSHPSPSYSRPSPPSTNIGWNPSVTGPKTTIHQTNSAPPPRGPTNTKPIGWDVNKPSIGNNGPPHPPPNTQTHYPGTNQRPTTNIRYPGNNQNPTTNIHYPGSGTTGINRKPVTTVNSPYRPPPPPGPHGPPLTGGTSVYNGPQKVKIVNKYYTNNPGYYSLPQPNYHYPGYYYTPSYYHYSSTDTGSGALGFFLGYSLAKVTTPTYSHYSFYDGYRPRYDHYTVVHYHHNKEQAPRDPIIQQNSIVGCVGDSNLLCPGNTTSLCTSDGTLMCVVSATHTQPCTDNRQVNCVRSTVPCVNNTIDACKDSNTTIINIPCVTTAKVFGNITYVNNTIIINNNNTTTPMNATINNTTTTTTTTTSLPLTSTQYPITTTPTSNTQYPITTTPDPMLTTTPGRRKRDTNNGITTPQQNFCVTIVALPAKKQEAEGEKLFKTTKSIISNFIVNAWGLRN